MGALYMGNKPVLKVDSKVSIVMEQMIRLLHECGLPAEDVDFINSDGITMNKLLLEVWLLFYHFGRMFPVALEKNLCYSKMI